MSRRGTMAPPINTLHVTGHGLANPPGPLYTADGGGPGGSAGFAQFAREVGT
jgi:hypothetical protein